jgi:hypothetical protein
MTTHDLRGVKPRGTPGKVGKTRFPTATRYANLEELLELIFAWLGAENPFPVEDKVYRRPKAA